MRLDDLELVRLLLRAGANANAANRYGVTPLELAAINGNAGDHRGAAEGGRRRQRRAARRRDRADDGGAHRQPEAMQALLAHGADVNAQEAWLGETALMWAAAENHGDAVSVLLAGRRRSELAIDPDDLHAQSRRPDASCRGAA